jgi:hypothetical protein
VTAILPDPQEDFWAQDPSILTEPEQAQAEEIQRGKMPIALGLAASYLLYRAYMSRRLKQETRKMGGEVTRHALLLSASLIWNAYIPRWVAMTAPYLVAGYIEGVQSADSGRVPLGYLERIAEGYAEELGNHLNEVSKEALVSGYQAQVNRKVPPAMAARRVADAYGVPQRGMNALVNVWSTEEKATYSDRPLPSVKADRAQALIEAQNQLRARQVGENEHWAARTQAKQIVWMYGQNSGVIPESARRVWITANDEKVCSICGPLDGMSAPVGEKFTTESGKVWTPPAHVNCRCDVALDLIDFQSELTSFLENESVAKAMGQDRYDRDKRGRFARDESRQVRYKQREQNIDAMLAQVDEALKVELPEVKPLTATPVKNKLMLSPLKAPKKLKALSAPSKTDTKNKLKGELKRDVRVKMKLDSLSAELWRPQKIRREDLETAEGTWEYMDEVLTTVMDPYQHHDIGDTVMHDDTTPFYEEYSSGQAFDPKRSGMNPRTLGEAIGDYWEGWAAAEMEEFRLNQGGTQARSNLYHHEGTDTTWLVTEEAYEAVLEDLINGTPKMHQEVVELDGLNDNEGETLTVTTGEIAAQFGIKSKMENDAPILLQTRHGMPGVTEKLAGHEWRNPGRWRVVNIREVWDPHDTNYHHLGYTILEVEPADLYSGE